MQIAVVLFEGFAALDAVAPHHALADVPGVHLVFAAEQIGPISSDKGRLALVADVRLEEIPHPEMLVVPGGSGRSLHMANGSLHQWLRTADLTSRWTVGVGEGTLLLAAAGPLQGRRVAIPSSAQRVEAARIGALPAEEQIVVDGKYATAVDGVACLELAAQLRRRIHRRLTPVPTAQ